ncbi:MAG: hypothetical protein A2V66_14365 [Ignavibacteria bacterium RBG_13_36_8]|nr:MAG: hypothetical protein A2V66_14365 [Ignavibacteria bacterium RBG_13_36_8]
MKPIKYFLFLLIPLSIYANGGSVYSRYGIGNLILLNSARNLGLGSIGFAVTDGNYINSLNPASWNILPMTRFEAGLKYSGISLRDNNNSNLYSDVVFSGFVIGFPIDRELGISLVGGLIPYSNVEYEVIQNLQSPGIDDDYILDLKGNGGVNKFFIGASYRLPFDVSIGASLEYYTGKIEYTSKIDFATGSQYKDAVYLDKYIYRGVGFNLGLISNDLSELLGINNLENLRIGINYNFSPTLKTDTTLYTGSSVGSKQIESALVDSEIPSRLGIGVSLLWNKNYLFLFDYILQPWSEFKFANENSNYLTNFSRMSLGFEYKNRTVRFSNAWEQISLRCGLSYEQSQYSFYGTNINEYSIYGGLSFPIGIESSIDFGIQYGMRGTTDNNLLKENIFNAFLSINFGELWFIRQER